MNNITPNKKPKKSLMVTGIGWLLIAFFTITFATAIPNTIKDINTLKNNGVYEPIMLVAVLLIAAIMVLIPIILSVGILYRKNWGRIGIMLTCLIGIGVVFYYTYLMKIFYSKQLLWALFYLFIFTVLNSCKYKSEFINQNNIKVLP